MPNQATTCHMYILCSYCCCSSPVAASPLVVVLVVILETAQCLLPSAFPSLPAALTQFELFISFWHSQSSATTPQAPSSSAPIDAAAFRALILRFFISKLLCFYIYIQRYERTYIFLWHYMLINGATPSCHTYVLSCHNCRNGALTSLSCLGCSSNCLSACLCRFCYLNFYCCQQVFFFLSIVLFFLFLIVPFMLVLHTYSSPLALAVAVSVFVSVAVSLVVVVVVEFHTIFQPTAGAFCAPGPWTPSHVVLAPFRRYNICSSIYSFIHLFIQVSLVVCLKKIYIHTYIFFIYFCSFVSMRTQRFLQLSE